MKPIRNFFIALLLGLLIIACGSKPELEKAEFLVFGTIMEISVLDTDPARAHAAFTELQDVFQAMHRDWHAWEPGLLTRINDAFAAGQAALANPDIVTLVQRSQEIEGLSEGCFNPAIGALIRLWGFHTSDYPVIGPPPTDQDISALLDQAPSSRSVHIDGLNLRSDNRAVQLDFGGIAKGYAIDIAIDLLRSKGIENAIVNAGGDLRAMGGHSDRPWRIAIRNAQGGIVGTINTSGDEAIFTSGVYERFRVDETRRFPHILDPRSGWPVAGLVATTVISDEGLLADAAATALIVAGPRDAFRIARSLGLSEVLLIDENGTVYLTPEMERRIEFLDGVERKVIAPPQG